MFDVQRFADVSLTAGNDTYPNTGAGNAIYGLAGNDTITNNSGANVTIDGGAGDDIISSGGENSVIIGGAGNDTISLSGKNAVVQYSAGSGNDIINGFSSDDKIQIASGNYTVKNSGNDVILDFGSESLTIKNVLTTPIQIMNGAGTITTVNTVSVINNTANDTLISSTSSRASIISSGRKVTINATTGNDTINSSGEMAVLNGNGGDDNISVSGANSTIKGGAGNDSISLSNGFHVVQYANGDGNDFVSGWANSDTLQITAGSISSADYVNNNLIFGIGTNTITVGGTSSINLKLADGKDTIFGSADITPTWTIVNGTAIYKNALNTLITVSGLSSLASANDLSVNNNTVTIKANALGNTTVNISSGYVFELASDVTKSTADVKTWTVNNGTATYKSTTTAGYKLSSDKKSITYETAKSDSTLAKVTGLATDTTVADISVKNKVITLKNHALSRSNTAKISSGYTLALGTDVVTPTADVKTWTVNNGTATYKSGTTAGYKLSSDKKSVVYEAATNDSTLATITGLATDTTVADISVKNKVITLKNHALSRSNTAKVSSGYTLALDIDVAQSGWTAAGWDLSKTTATYKSEKISKGYTLSNDKTAVSLVSSSGGETYTKITGLVAGLELNDGAISGLTYSKKSKTFTISSKVMGSDSATSITGAGYTYKLSGAGKLTNKGGAVTFEGSSKKDTLIGGSKADTIFGNNGADYLAGYGGDDSISGGKGADTISGGAGNDTISGGSGNDILTGGKGNDVFVYKKSTGNDIITDYTAGDKIKITSGHINRTTYTSTDVIFKIGSGTLTIKNGNGKKITIIDEDGKTTTKKYSKNFSNLFESDNLAEIMEDKISVAEMQPEDKKSAQENLITFADK